MDKRGGGGEGVSRFCCQKFFVWECRKTSWGNPSVCHYFRVWKYFRLQRVMSRFCVETFLSHSAEKSRRGTFLICASENFSSRRNIWIRGGSITIFCQNFLSDSAEKLRRGTHQCVIIFGYRKILGFRELCHDFVSKLFCLTVPKISVGIPSMFQKVWAIENFYASERKGVSRFSVENICHTVPKVFVGEQFCVSGKFVYRKNLCIRGGITKIRWKIFGSHCR